MGKKEKQQSLAGRDSQRTGSGRVPGDQGGAENVGIDRTGEQAKANDDAAALREPVQESSGGLGQGNEAVKARAYEPPACCSCQALRPKGKSYSYVYATLNRGYSTVRYIKCKFCGDTWKTEVKNGE